MTAAGQFHEDHERDMADPEYVEAYREAEREVTAALADVLRPFVAPSVLDRAVAAVEATEASRAYALPRTEAASCMADDGTMTWLPGTWIDHAIKALDNRWDRGWTGGTISTVAVVGAAFEAASRGEEPPLWEDRTDE